MKESTKIALNRALNYARHKHPTFTNTMGSALLLAQEELGEAIQAYNNDCPEEVFKELAHTAAVLIRILNKEYVSDENKQNDKGAKFS